MGNGFRSEAKKPASQQEDKWETVGVREEAVEQGQTEGDLHNKAHQPRVIKELPGGFALVASVESTGRHWRLDLALGEDPATELLGCWEGDPNWPAPSWGVELEQAMEIAVHVAEHVATGLPPHKED